MIVFRVMKGTFKGCCIFKICSNRLCNFTQHYRYHTIGDYTISFMMKIGVHLSVLFPEEKLCLTGSCCQIWI